MSNICISAALYKYSDAKTAVLEKDAKYRVVFFTGTPQFQYQKENPPSNQSWPFLVKRFIRTAALIGWLAVFFLVLKSGGTSEKNHPVK